MASANTNGHCDAAESYKMLKNGRQQPQIVAGLDRPLEQKPLGEQTRAVRRQVWMVVLGNVGLLSAGMALAFPTVTLRQLTDPNETVHLTEAQASWFASINTLSCPLGGLLSALLLDKIGRKNSLYVLNVLSLIAWGLVALAVQEDSESVYIQLLISRFIIGIAAGLASAPAGVYAAEISVPKTRGRLILGTSISFAAGITLIFVLGYFIRDDWHLLALISCAYQVVAMLCIIPMPETPNWLIAKGRLQEAKQSLNYFRGLDKTAAMTHPAVIAEYNVLEKSIQLGVGMKKPSFLKSLRQPEVYKPLLILMGLFAFQQVTGIFVVVVYAVQVATEAGVSIDPFMCAILVGLARLLTTFPMGIILEKWGRRCSGLISALGMMACMFLLAGHAYFEVLHEVPYLPVVAIVSFIVLSTLGLYTLPFIMLSELLPQKVRGPGSGLTIAVGMFISFVCIKTYPGMKSAIGGEFCFVIYGTMAFIAMVFVYLVLPETRGRTLLEIEEAFRSGKSLRSRSPQPVEVEMQEVFIK